MVISNPTSWLIVCVHAACASAGLLHVMQLIQLLQDAHVSNIVQQLSLTQIAGVHQVHFCCHATVISGLTQS